MYIPAYWLSLSDSIPNRIWNFALTRSVTSTTYRVYGGRFVKSHSPHHRFSAAASYSGVTAAVTHLLPSKISSVPKSNWHFTSSSMSRHM
jgi:hypothetical protein